MLVVTASDGELAWQKLEEASPPFDIVISDVYMPRLDGFGLITKIRESPKYNETALMSMIYYEWRQTTYRL